AIEALARLQQALAQEELAAELSGLLTPDEVSTTIQRVELLLDHRVHPFPPEDWPAVPWPPIEPEARDGHAASPVGVPAIIHFGELCVSTDEPQPAARVFAFSGQQHPGGQLTFTLFPSAVPKGSRLDISIAPTSIAPGIRAF